MLLTIRIFVDHVALLVEVVEGGRERVDVVAQLVQLQGLEHVEEAVGELENLLRQLELPLMRQRQHAVGQRAHVLRNLLPGDACGPSD